MVLEGWTSGEGVLLKAPHCAHTHCTQLVGKSEKSWYLENCLSSGLRVGRSHQVPGSEVS